jgi:hypothetical protein
MIGLRNANPVTGRWQGTFRTFVYLDGVNLYIRALKGTPYKRLDIEAMSRAVLPSTCAIERINYYTANISGRVDPDYDGSCGFNRLPSSRAIGL